ncbi:MAG TPA: 4-hydroxyphenylacetate 3-hydroxylase family protein [Syntrophorhabdaceae bacterium]|jgi:4-hydroxybutyryl-CoA dehydratase/vinylacetyl-CoA-Delta-isomerase|nr:4-hydroxyphenylacetate 3-hydroxylase family protein [Syntrophorhabdaceae bacterium]MDI9561027.1 4-hydroxyphenylacetate 3-hydroxylase family protein [Pseudomonadota bacterium]MBP8698862.1 4-hydroxyphenylacetate 3-hydroxylase family protein [Syntrophorhabdaceae bacterium]MBV6506282.1 4-hydroxybutyryl-CoA dehydratase/vinylacetyl-CoA-Delta-isomerase [Syntrophorhabdaceae bacterium]HNQ62644.1 4-hydroxyphenylacetate 3-hydroxylase family protein [Syntrophorhabdaceae bacterium]
MPLMTSSEYIESLRKQKKRIFLAGKMIDNYVDHPIIRPSINACAMTYELSHKPEHEELLTAASSLTGKKINRFTHLHQSTEDLIKKVKMQRLLGQKTGCCFQRCVGFDGFNAVDSVTYEMDEEFGTEYNKRFRAYLEYVQENDLVVDGAMTDTKGNRKLAPSEQQDPDQFVHVVEKKPNGIIVRGAKAHQTGAINSHEILVMPTQTMREADKDYAVSFAVPADAKGILYIYGRQSCDTRRLEEGDIDVGNAMFGGQEALIVFNDVFVPWERVFMCGEYQYSGALVERFAGYHRQSYGGCKSGVGDVLIGAAQAISKIQGVEKASHIKDKLVEMTHLNETIYACGVACSAEGSPTKSGTYLIDLMLANVCKLHVTHLPYLISRLAQDVAGGLVVTLPGEQDFKNPEIRQYLEKYFRSATSYSTEDRCRMQRLIENLTLGMGAVGYLTESLHGAGSPQAQKIMIGRLANFDYKAGLAEELAGIKK